ncbi:hypothetical protein [Streptomyces sp. NPDC093149]|uniref:hypothetical protein n=1 Tax=Streptomyces sp. NPDC093149 TaxID=3366031 RepID=UPI0038014181
MRSAIRNAVMKTTATAVLLGGVAAVASPASAVGSGACTQDGRAHSVWGPNFEWPGIHDGPGVAYKTKGHLDSAGEFYVECSTINKYGNKWYYGEVLSGPTGGMKGWIAAGWF